jgi:hypothetical protein
MKALFLLLYLLTDGDAIRNFIHCCFTSGMVCAAALFSLGSYQVLRRSFARRNTGSPSGA